MHIEPAKARPQPPADGPAAIEAAPTDGAAANGEGASAPPAAGNEVALVDAGPIDDPLYQGAPPAWLVEALGGLDMESFLSWWGRCALNVEDEGGLFLAYAGLNHSCNPSGRLDRRAGPQGSSGVDMKPSRLFLTAMHKLAKGDEVTVTCVDQLYAVILTMPQLH